MSNIFTITNDALAAITPAVEFAQNTFLGALPDTYLVYKLISSPPEQHAENKETLRSYRIQVSIYSKSGLAVLPDVDTPMLAAGFLKSDMKELPHSQSTAHFGLAKDYVILLPI